MGLEPGGAAYRLRGKKTRFIQIKEKPNGYELIASMLYRGLSNLSK